LNEWNLIERLKQGDAAAFREIVESSQDLVYNTAIGIVQSAEDAEDVAQEVFVSDNHQQGNGSYPAPEPEKAVCLCQKPL